MSDKTDAIINFLLATLGILLLSLTIILFIVGFVMIKDTQANIKIKERIANNGIEITTKQIEEYSIEELLKDEL